MANPLLYFGLTALFLWGMPFFSLGSLAAMDNLKESESLINNLFFKETENLSNSSLFFSQSSQLVKETPDLKIIQDAFVYGVSTPRILNTQTLGDIFGNFSSERREIEEYVVEERDTMASVAEKFGISKTTLALANEISTNSTLKVGQELVILPVDGLLHVVRSGDTVSELTILYKAKEDDINSYNDVVGGIFIGQILVIPYGKIPAKPVQNVQVALPNSFFIYPAEGRISQGLHYYNGVDVANNCGTPVYASASGIVQRVRFDYRYGYYITILHSNGVATYYGHLQSMFVQSGTEVALGERIGLIGRTGTKATGCHVHFQVMGAANPLAKYSVGTILKY